jgi:hypothetical protein
LSSCVTVAGASAPPLDRLDGVSVHEPIPPDLLAEITIDRLAAAALDRLLGDYAVAVQG